MKSFVGQTPDQIAAEMIWNEEHQNTREDIRQNLKKFGFENCILLHGTEAIKDAIISLDGSNKQP